MCVSLSSSLYLATRIFIYCSNSPCFSNRPHISLPLSCWDASCPLWLACTSRPLPCGKICFPRAGTCYIRRLASMGSTTIFLGSGHTFVRSVSQSANSHCVMLCKTLCVHNITYWPYVSITADWLTEWFTEWQLSGPHLNTCIRNSHPSSSSSTSSPPHLLAANERLDIPHLHCVWCHDPLLRSQW